MRNPWFRYLHLGAIAFVAAEALLGVMCPLTVWEDLLRGGVRAESFVGRWVRYFLYYQAPEWVFTAAYVAWTLATLVTLRLVPPRSHQPQSVLAFLQQGVEPLGAGAGLRSNWPFLPRASCPSRLFRSRRLFPRYWSPSVP